MTDLLERDVQAHVAALLHLSPAEVSRTAVLSELVQDSFLLVELVIDLQEHFEVRFHSDDVGRIVTVGDLAAVVAARSTGSPS